MEAQTTWSVNILIRCLIYIAQTIQNFIVETEQNVYTNKKVSIPEPEFYVIFTGDRKEKPTMLTFSKEFFDGRETALDIRVTMIYDSTQGDIINQYITFTRIYKEQYRIHGRTQKTVLETIRICKDKNILKKYLESREKEVVDIMMTLFNQEYALKVYTKEIKETGILEAKKSTALKLARRGTSIDMIAELIDAETSLVEEWLAESFQ